MVAADGTLDKITKQAGRAFDNFMNGIIATVDRALTAGVGMVSGDSAPNSEPKKGTGNWLMNLLSGGEPEPEAPAVPKEGEKLGRGQRDREAVALAETQPKPPNYFSPGDIGQLATQFAHVAPLRSVDGAAVGQG